MSRGKSCLKGEFRILYKVGSNERAWKIQKNETPLTFMPTGSWDIALQSDISSP